MSHQQTELSLKKIKSQWHGTLKGYVIGFIGSLLITILAFSLVYYKILSGHFLDYTVVGLGLLQALVQLLFFLHLGQEAKPRWETVAFGFMVLVLLIIALGSLWIMYDLEERVMPTMQQEMTHD